MTMTAEEVEFHLEYGHAVSALLEPITVVLALIRVAELHGWDAGMSEYRDILIEADRLLTKMGEVSAGVRVVHQHNLEYLAADGETQH